MEEWDESDDEDNPEDALDNLEGMNWTLREKSVKPIQIWIFTGRRRGLGRVTTLVRRVVQQWEIRVPSVSSNVRILPKLSLIFLNTRGWGEVDQSLSEV